MSTSPASGRRAGGWKRLRRIDSDGDRDSSPKASTAKRRGRDVITLDDEDDDDGEAEEERKEGKAMTVEAAAEGAAGQAEDDTKGAVDDEYCSICLGAFSDTATLDSCSHTFCFVCIFRWCTDVSPSQPHIPTSQRRAYCATQTSAAHWLLSPVSWPCPRSATRVRCASRR